MEFERNSAYLKPEFDTFFHVPVLRPVRNNSSSFAFNGVAVRRKSIPSIGMRLLRKFGVQPHQQRWVICGVLLACLDCHAADLLDAYALARLKDPTLLQAFANREASREIVSQARAHLLPQVTAGLSWLREQRAATHNYPSSRTNERGPSVVVNQTLLDLSKLASWRSSKAQVASQDAIYRAAQQALPVRVATAYFNVLVAAETLDYVQANEDAFAEQVRNAEGRYKSGLSALSDLNQARAYHSSARTSTVNARLALSSAREALTQITGSSIEALRRLRDDIPLQPPQPADPAAWAAFALEKNPLLQAQRELVVAAERNIDVARAGHLPTLNASVSSGKPATWPNDGSDDNGQRMTTLGVTLVVPLFSGGAVQSQVRQAVAQRESTKQGLELLRRQVVADVQNQYRSALADIEQIGMTREGVDAAQRALASTRVGQQTGARSMTDLLLSIQLLAAQQIAYSESRHKFILDMLLLRQSAGTVNYEDLSAINAQLQ